MLQFRDYPFASVLTLVASFALVGCGTAARLAAPVAPPEPVPTRTAVEPAVAAEPAPAPREAPPVLSRDAVIAQHLLAAHRSWDGVPYRFGGTTRSGIDCSAFTQQVMADYLGVRISRSTHTQVDEGVEVPRHDLRPGDLVFFRTGARQRHVGIYVGGGRMLHSASRRGVTIDPINHGFYDNTYWTARRVISPERAAVLLAAAQEEPSPRMQPPAAARPPSVSGPASVPARTAPPVVQPQQPPPPAPATRSTSRTGW
jgi:cell wall-associated NlpC family hydrolase